ncbi:NUDIX hydrolase [Rubrivivax gelatinosus]|uniref:Phosphatase NudJ n=1 Tax=Rubrivivax gelatinosus TaxID=28068 RepID=A0A4R2LUD5_RUBGE|nr:NUDIX hydrolase [Rubrivivax gelatinosus]MBK1689955.1 NUDIX hydrolase [Rubrivivax gelatinosus]TCO97691.1 ADP-ribose pyrophosphatase YjhB (NUDIX family) [Rubrivivax gelatinosus]
MPSTRWTPFVTVAAVVEHEGRYLLVEEQTPDGLRLNNPAGHLECGESPLEAVVRETLEETTRAFTPEALLGLYLSRFVRPGDDRTYLRIAYAGRVGEPLPGRTLDTGIVRTLWLTAEEIRAQATRLRSPLALQCVEDHLAGRRLPLESVYIHPSLWNENGMNLR